MVKAIKKIKVIQVIDSLSPGGAETMAVNIANLLAENGIESHLCVTRLEGDLKIKVQKNVGYVFLNKKKVIDFTAIKKLHNYIKKHQIAILHAHSSSFFIAILIKFFNASVQIIWHDHYGKSEQLEARKKKYLKPASYFFTQIITVNRLLFNWAKENLYTKKIIYMPNFAILNKNIPKTTHLSGEVGKRIVCLANLRPQKDHLNLVKAFKIFVEKQEKWTLHLVGIDTNDTYSKAIHLFIKENKLTSKIFLYGSCLDTYSILKQATIGVLASKSEGLPIALLEYGLAKLPVVITNVGECATVLQQGKNGFRQN